MVNKVRKDLESISLESVQVKASECVSKIQGLLETPLLDLEICSELPGRLVAKKKCAPGEMGVNLPHPSLVHFLLGFSIQKPLQKSQLQNPGVYGTPKNCLHSLVNILDENLKGLVDAAVVMEGYKLLHVILSHGSMSYPVLRFMKGNLRNFLVRHGEALPFSASPTMEQQNSTAHLLLCIAIDVRVSSLRGSTSQAQKLASVIFTSERTVDSADGEAGQRRDAGISNLLSRTFASITGILKSLIFLPCSV
ncbi:nuclear pore complex protein Nup205-like [Artemia franciscana]|uniref:nuclear pore complex protein Nup205-like n=1 Tax=Artemia franciscana TaxID=6661 RepID=UPI0032DAC7E1